MNREEFEQVIYDRTRNFVDGRVMDCIFELIAEEREACAKACEKLIDTFSSSQYKTGQPWSSIGERFAVSSCAAAIRARGEV